jgi:hypothetical protein
LIPAFLGGYPVGARCVADLYHNKALDKPEAERLLAFCSNAGPAFLFGMVSAYFPGRDMVWKLWFIHIVSAILTSQFFPAPVLNSNKEVKVREHVPESEFMIPALKAIAVVCGWVILFRIGITFLKKWVFWALSSWSQVLITGILELSNGCCALSQIENEAARFILCGSMLAFGGVCVLFQTASVTNGLSLRNYIAGKCIQTVLSCFLCTTMIMEHGILYTGAASFALYFLMNFKNKCRNPNTFPV